MAEKHVILPTAHSEQDAPEQGHVMPVLRENRDLRRSAQWDPVIGNVVQDLNFRYRAVASAVAWSRDALSCFTLCSASASSAFF
jgi:hypothetical protein